MYRTAPISVHRQRGNKKGEPFFAYNRSKEKGNTYLHGMFNGCWADMRIDKFESKPCQLINN